MCDNALMAHFQTNVNLIFTTLKLTR